MSKVSFWTKQDKIELRKPKVTVTSVAVAKTNCLFGMCDYTVNSDIGTCDFSLVLGIFTCVDMCTCDRACLLAWAVLYQK